MGSPPCPHHINCYILGFIIDFCSDVIYVPPFTIQPTIYLLVAPGMLFVCARVCGRVCVSPFFHSTTKMLNFNKEGKSEIATSHLSINLSRCGQMKPGSGQ